MKKVALFDLDGTLVGAHAWVGVAKHNFKMKENIFSTIWYIISHVALAPLWKVGLISKEKYYKSWGKDTAQMLKRTRLDRVKEIFNWLSDKYLLPTLKKNIFEILKKHQKNGFLTILVSSSFQDLVDLIAIRLNIDFAIGTKLEVVKDKISGKIIPPLCFGQGKVELLKRFLAERNLDINFKESFAYSDSVSDLSMLQLVGNPIVVDPGKALLTIAKNKSWEIIT